jgi:hypothetical protein
VVACEADAFPATSVRRTTLVGRLVPLTASEQTVADAAAAFLAQPSLEGAAAAGRVLSHFGADQRHGKQQPAAQEAAASDPGGVDRDCPGEVNSATLTARLSTHEVRFGPANAEAVVMK